MSPHVEVELFDPENYSPARTINLLHRLGRPTVAAAPTHANNYKPLGVHITALTHSAAATAARPHAWDAAATGSAPLRRRHPTAEGLYRSHLANRSSQTHATHHAAYGGITSTVPISREAVEESGRKEPGERAAAFRVRDDAVMGGGNTWIDERDDLSAGARHPGRRRRGGGGPGADWVPHGHDPYSDDETEAHAEQAYREAEEAALAAQAREDRDRSLFYQYRHGGGVDRRIKPRGERTFKVPPKEDGMLLRLMPYMPPWEEAERPVPQTGEAGVSEGKGGRGGGRPSALDADADDEKGRRRKSGDVPSAPTLTKKRRRDETAASCTPFDALSGSTLFFGHSSSSSSPSRLLREPTLSSSSSLSSSSEAPTPVASFPFSTLSPALVNSTTSQGAKTKMNPPLYTPRSEPKNLVKTGTALPKRSTLAAFRVKR